MRYLWLLGLVPAAFLIGAFMWLAWPAGVVLIAVIASMVLAVISADKLGWM